MREPAHNRGNQWTHADDLQLVKLVGQVKSNHLNWIVWGDIGRKLGRSSTACQTRWCMIKALLLRSTPELTELRAAAAQAVISRAVTAVTAAEGEHANLLEILALCRKAVK